MGADRTSIAWRRGRCITKIESRRGIDTMEIVGLVGRIIREDKPDRINIDVTGMGVGIVDRLYELGHSRSLVQAINFAGKPVEPPESDETGKPAGGPANRRAELYSNSEEGSRGRPIFLARFQFAAGRLGECWLQVRQQRAIVAGK